MAEPSLAVVNPEAGSYDEDEVDAIVEALGGRSAIELVETASPDELDDALERLEGRRLVVLGGDGSVHAAAGALGRLDLLEATTVAIVPMGTGNDFAGGLGFALGAEAAGALVAGADERRFDLIRTDDAILVNAAHAGIGAVAAEKASSLKQLLGDAAYKAGALAAGMSAGPWDLRVTVDGEELRPPGGEGVLLVAVANGPRVGGGTDLCPDARPDDGQLDVLLTTASSPAQRAGLGIALLKAEHADREDVATARGKEVVVEGEPVPWNLDGELPGEASRRTFTLLPGALRLLVPRST